MIRAKIRSGYLIFTIMIILLGGPFFKVNASKSQVPEGLVIEKTFKTGQGLPVGIIRMVHGEVIIIHSDMQRGYMAEKKLPLFKGDTIISKNKGRIQLEFRDGSTLTMSSNSQLVITQSIYEPTAKSRSSFIKMGFGKIRFIVRKLTGFKVSEFKVKTKTAVIGVRGSDFIISSSQDSTEITTLKNTVLEVVSMADPETPTLLTDFEQASVESGSLPSEAKKMHPEEIEQMILEMVIPQDRIEPDETLRVQNENTVQRKGENDIVGKHFAKSFEHETGKSFARPDHGKMAEKIGQHELPAKHGQPRHGSLINVRLELADMSEHMQGDMHLNEMEQGGMHFEDFGPDGHEDMMHDEMHEHVEKKNEECMNDFPSFPLPPGNQPCDNQPRQHD